MPEQVDILLPPNFKKSGQVKDRGLAWADGDWMGTFNLWIVQDNPKPALVYQVRSQKSSWAPGKLDVTAGGHYQAGDTEQDGLREVEEELGKQYDFSDLVSIGRKLHVSPDEQGRMRKNVVDIFFVKDNSPIDTYELEEQEVSGLCVCNLKDLVRVHTEEGFSFKTTLVDHSGSSSEISVDKGSFPYNWDNYHLKIVLLAERYLAEDEHLLY